MNKTVPPIIAFLAIILVAGIAGAAIFLFGQKIQDDLLIDKETRILTETVKEDDNWIFLEEEILAEQEGSLLFYYEFYIDQDTKLIFDKHDKTGFLNNWKGDIILEQNNERIFIKEDTEIYGPGGFSYSIYRTNFPNLIILRTAFGAVVSGVSWFEYFDLEKKEIIATKTHRFRPSHLITIEREEEEIKIDFDMDSCQNKLYGDLIEVRGILLNGTPIFFQEGPFLIVCEGGMTDIELYAPYVYFEEITPNFSFSKLKFNINIKNIQNKESYNEWQKLIILDLESHEAVFEDVVAKEDKI